MLWTCSGQITLSQYKDAINNGEDDEWMHERFDACYDVAEGIDGKCYNDPEARTDVRTCNRTENQDQLETKMDSAGCYKLFYTQMDN